MTQQEYDANPLDHDPLVVLGGPNAPDEWRTIIGHGDFKTLLAAARGWRRTARGWRALAWSHIVALWALVLVMVLTGCTTSPRMPAPEITWQAIHAIDTAQTVAIARNPKCLQEASKISAWVYGTNHPSVSRVLSINAAGALLHWQASAWAERSGNRLLRGAFYATSILWSGQAVGNNLMVGIRPIAGGQCRHTDVMGPTQPRWEK